MAWYRCGGGGLPSGLQSDMDAVLNKKFSTSTTYPPTDWAPTVNLMGPLPEKTESGAIANFTDGADGVPLKNWLVTLPASLDGYTAVNAVKAGKNLFDGYTKGYGVNSSTGAIFTNQNGAISGYIPIKPNTAFYVSGLTDTIHSFVAYYKADKTYISRTSGSNRTYVSATTPPECFFVIVYQYANNDVGTIDDVDNLQTQLEVGSMATAYEAYTAPTTYTASLGRTIYGGTADIVTGEGSVTHGKKVFDGTEGTGGTPSWTMISVSQGTMFRITVSDKATTSATNTLCSYYTPVAQAQRADGTVSGAGTNVDIIDNRFSSVDAFKAWLAENPVTLVYELATPTDFTFTPITPTPETTLGVNNFWADEGDSDVTYRADISLALQALGGGGRGLMMMRPTEPEETEETEETEGLEDELNR